jgi:hypothetical protein
MLRQEKGVDRHDNDVLSPVHNHRWLLNLSQHRKAVLRGDCAPFADGCQLRGQAFGLIARKAWTTSIMPQPCAFSSSAESDITEYGTCLCNVQGCLRGSEPRIDIEGLIRVALYGLLALLISLDWLVSF